MDIISKIEIKHFRSFDGGKDQPKIRIEELKDINVFSGSNDSGKSNVLRAINRLKNLLPCQVRISLILSLYFLK